MFGLGEDKKKKKYPEFVYDLENNLQKREKHEEILKHIQDRFQKIRNILRSGEKKESYDRYGILLHGYTSLLKVMSRFQPK